jgi:hypothetical protein
MWYTAQFYTRTAKYKVIYTQLSIENFKVPKRFARPRNIVFILRSIVLYYLLSLLNLKPQNMDKV